MIVGSASTRSWRLFGVLITGSSLLLALLGAGVLIFRFDDLFLALSEPVFWHPPHEPHPMSEDTRLGQSIGFGFFAAVSLVQALLLARADDRAMPLIARALLAGHVLWFVLDSTGSWVSGAVGNVVTNIGYAVMLAIPLGALSRTPTGTSDPG